MELFLQGKSVNSNGSIASLWTRKVEYKTTERPRSGQTVTGYGKAVPTQYLVKHNDKWRRVYCCIFSKSATFYIKKPEREMIPVK